MDLRAEQERALSELKEMLPEKRLCLKGATDSGKSLVYLSLIFEEELFPAVISTPDYENVDNVLKELEKWFDISNLTIVLPEGKDRIRKKICRKRSCSNCNKYKKKKEIAPSFGIWNKERIAEEYPDYCPYHALKKLSKKADLVICVHAMLTESDFDVKGRILIIDEAQEGFEPKSLLLLDFDVVPDSLHLQKSEIKSNIEKLEEIAVKLANNNPFSHPREKEEYEYQTRFHLLPLIQTLKHILPPNPIYYEAEVIEKKLPEPFNKASIKLRLAPSKLEEEAKSYNIIIKRKESFPNPKIPYSYLKSLNREERKLLLSFLEIWQDNPQLVVRNPQTSPRRKGFGGIEIYIVNEGYKKWERIFKKFDHILIVSATPPDIDWITVELDYKSKKPTILYIPPELYGKTIEVLKDKNILGITSSKERAKEAKKKFGGKCLHQDIKVKELEAKAKTQKGLLIWDYIDSKTSRGTNRLYFFDGFITFNPRNIDPAYEGDNISYIKKKAEEAYQHGSRVFRTVNGVRLKKFGIIDDKEIFDVLKDMVSDWEFIEVKSESELREILKGCETVPVNDRIVEIVKRFSEKEKKSEVRLRKINGEWYLEKYTNLKVGDLTEEEVEELKQLLKANPSYSE